MTTSMRFGDLSFQFTDQFTPAWIDKHSWSPMDGSFWTPVPQESGFRPLGGIGFFGPDHKGYEDPNGKQWALCVADATDAASGRMPAVAAPLRYVRVWSDLGTHAKANGSCWRPIPPDNYVACGDIFVHGHNDAPSTYTVWCVRKDLVHAGEVGGQIWMYSRPSEHIVFSAWQINAPIPFVEPGLGLFAANTFLGVGTSSPPSGGAEVYVLKVPLPSKVFEGQPAAPVLKGYENPESMTTEPRPDHIVTVPFTAIRDDGMTLAEQVRTSPFYTIRRSAYYTLQLYDYNKTSLPQSKTFSLRGSLQTSLYGSH